MVLLKIHSVMIVDACRKLLVSVLLLFSPSLVFSFDANYTVPPLMAPKQSYKVGIQQAYTPDLTLTSSLYNFTFGSYMTEALNTSFNTIPLTSDAEILELVQNGSLDFAYIGPTTYSCINLQYGYSAAVSFINYVGSTPSQVLAGAIVTQSNRSDIGKITDLVDKRIGCASLTQLTGCQSQWIELQKNGLDLFKDASQVLFGNNSQQVLQNLITGSIDVGFLGPGQVEGFCAKSSDPGCLSKFKFLNSQEDPRINGKFSTALYPGSTVAVSPLVDLDLRKKFAKVLLSIRASDEPAMLGQYYGWTSPYTYSFVTKQQELLGFIEDGVCREVNSLYDIVDCPTGFIKVNSQQSAENCNLKGIPCPSAFDCVCYPCTRAENSAQFGKLGVRGLIGLVVGASSLLIAICIFAVFITVLRIDEIPFKLIKLDVEIGKSGLGRVFRGKYDGTEVIVKRAFPKRGFRKSVFDIKDDCSIPSLRPSSSRSSLCRLPLSVVRMIWYKLVGRRYHAKSVCALTDMHHNNIVSTMGVSYGNGDEILIVNEYMGQGSLYDLIHNKTFDMDVVLVLSLLKDVAAGMSYLHNRSRPVIGRNIRSHHLLLDNNYRCHIGTSFHKPDPGGRAAVWLAPEILRGERISKRSDIYAFGMFMYELIYKSEPFNNEDSSAILVEIMDTEADEPKRPQINRRPSLNLELENPLIDLMMACWSEDPMERPTIQTVNDRLTIFKHEPVYKEAKRQNEQNQKILESNFPPYILDALRKGEPIPYREHPSVTVFFSDIVGFTTISSSLQPVDVMSMLNRLYRGFDDLVVKHNLYKVETVADAFLAVGNMHTEQTDHVTRVANFALEALEYALGVKIDEDKEDCLTVRIGLHTGSIVGSVVGSPTSNPRFSLFGDAMNVGSRMETTSEPGRIQLSEPIALILKDSPLSVRLRRRAGSQFIKGKGYMITYWLASDKDLVQESRQKRLSKSSNTSEDHVSLEMLPKRLISL